MTLDRRVILVFGSNLRGYHGAGSAEAALAQHGAVMGQARGLQGNSYAIPTKEANIWQSRPLGDICKDVREFLAFARKHESWTFNVVKVGCGLAGYKEEQIAPFFHGAPPNVQLPPGWRSILIRLDKSDDSSGEVRSEEAQP